MRRLLLTSLVLLAVFAPIATPVTATDHEISAEDCIQHERHGERTAINGDGPVVSISRAVNDTTVRYSFSGTTSELAFSLPEGANVTNSSGFDVDGDDVERRYNGKNPTITVHYSGPAKGVSAVGTEEHFVFLLPQSDSTTLQFRTNQTAYIGGRFALLGPYEVATAEAGCQQIQVVAPTDSGVDLDRYARVLAEASRDLEIGPRYVVVTAFVAAGDIGPRNGYTPKVSDDGSHGASEFLISPGSEIESPQNTLVHEYVHTRQANLEPDWVAEGSAMFFTIQLSVENGWISTLEADAYYAGKANEQRYLADSVREENIPYVRGAFFFDSLSEELVGTNTTTEEVYSQINLKGYRESLDGDSPAHPTERQFSLVAQELSNRTVTPEYRVTYETSRPVLELAGPMVRNPVTTVVLVVILVVSVLKSFVGDGGEDGEGPS